MAFIGDQLIPFNVENKENGTISISELEDLGDDALGLQLLVQCHEATYFGVLNHLLKDHHRISIWLEKVCVPKSGSQLLIGIKKLYMPNILSIKIVGSDLEVQKRLLQEIAGEKKKLQSLIMKRFVAVEDTETSNFINEESCEHQSSNSELLFSEIMKHITSDIPRYKNTHRPVNLKIIDTNGNEFQEALNEIEKESLICICARGMKLSRSGTLMWLCVSTSDDIYIFDISKINPDVCFKSHLKDILCNINQVKIINDARRLQDYFAHQHEISLCNIFDTQATHIYLHMQEHKNQVPYLIKSLPALLQEYLGFSPKLLSQMFPDIVNETIWLERPLSCTLQNTLAFSVMFLRELRQCLLDLILVDLQQLNNIFVNSFNVKTSIEIQQVAENVVPFEIHQLGKPDIQVPKILYSKGKAS